MQPLLNFTQTLCKVHKSSDHCNTFTKFILLYTISSWEVGHDSSVGMVTHYGLDGPGDESRWGRDFPHLSRPALGPNQPSVQ